MTKRSTIEVQPSSAERSPRTHATSSKPGQNEQNSNVTDGAYFSLDGYGSRTTPRSVSDPRTECACSAPRERSISAAPELEAQAAACVIIGEDFSGLGSVDAGVNGPNHLKSTGTPRAGEPGTIQAISSRTMSQKQNESSLDSISGQRLGMRYMTAMAKQLLSDEKWKQIEQLFPAPPARPKGGRKRLE